MSIFRAGYLVPLYGGSRLAMTESPVKKPLFKATGGSSRERRSRVSRPS